jgi:hypothetical protein
VCKARGYKSIEEGKKLLKQDVNNSIKNMFNRNKPQALTSKPNSKPNSKAHSLNNSKM